jgi:hypothetical protein
LIRVVIFFPGLGFTGVKDTVWVEHQDDFNSLLATLNQKANDGEEKAANQVEDTSERSSLEVLSKKSTKRIQ